MTTPIIPDFIFNLYHNEIVKVVHRVVDCISEEYKLDKTKVLSLVEKNIETKMKLVSEDQEVIKIMKKKPRDLPEDCERCIANIRGGDGVVRRCTLRFCESEEKLCKRHFDKMMAGKDVVNIKEDKTKVQRKLY